MSPSKPLLWALATVPWLVAFVAAKRWKDADRRPFAAANPGWNVPSFCDRAHPHRNGSVA